MALEKRLWSWLSAGTPKTRGLHIQRVENGVGDGTPDVEGCWDGGCFWVELKQCRRPVRSASVLNLRHFTVGQARWLYRRRKAGGRSWLLVQVGSGKKASRYMIPGNHAPTVQQSSLTEGELAAFAAVRPHASAAEFIRVAAGKE